MSFSWHASKRELSYFYRSRLITNFSSHTTNIRSHENVKGTSPKLDKSVLNNIYRSKLVILYEPKVTSFNFSLHDSYQLFLL